MIQRAKIVPFAKGNVLEIGIGSGLNLSFYDKKKVTNLVGIDPAIELWNKRELLKNNLGFQFIVASAEDLPFENNTFDTVVLTYTLCIISNIRSAIESIRSVLIHNGKLLFCERGKALDKRVLQIQNLINPMWKSIGGGYNLNRNIPLIIKQNGFQISDLKSMYVPGCKPASYNFFG
jgi:ubiquinone/menaquinone biosynthesis C-methylase UbiE